MSYYLIIYDIINTKVPGMTLLNDSKDSTSGLHGMFVVYVIALLITVVIYLEFQYVVPRSQLAVLSSKYGIPVNNYVMLSDEHGE